MHKPEADFPHAECDPVLETKPMKNPLPVSFVIFGLPTSAIHAAEPLRFTFGNAELAPGIKRVFAGSIDSRENGFGFAPGSAIRPCAISRANRSRSPSRMTCRLSTLRIPIPSKHSPFLRARR